MLIISGQTLLFSSTVWIYQHLNCLCVATGVCGVYLWERNFSALCQNSLGIAELKEARLCEGDEGWLCLTAQAAFFLVTLMGKKTSSAVLPQLPQVSYLVCGHGQIQWDRCICSLQVIGLTEFSLKLSLKQIPGVAWLHLIGYLLEVTGRFGNLMYINLILMFNRAADTVSLCLFVFALLKELEW